MCSFRYICMYILMFFLTLSLFSFDIFLYIYILCFFFSFLFFFCLTVNQTLVKYCDLSLHVSKFFVTFFYLFFSNDFLKSPTLLWLITPFCNLSGSIFCRTGGNFFLISEIFFLYQKQIFSVSWWLCPFTSQLCPLDFYLFFSICTHS